MPSFTRTYSREVEDAVASAYEDRRIRPMARVLELAKAGELREGLTPADVPMATARGWVLTLRKRRAGEIKSKVAEQPDAPLILKRKLLAMAEEESEFEKRKKPGNRDLERIRQIARAIREAQAIADKGTPPAPGQRSPDTGKMDNGGTTRGGLGGSILAAARGTGHRPGDPTPTTPSTETTETATHDQAQSQDQSTGSESEARHGASSSV